MERSFSGPPESLPPGAYVERRGGFGWNAWTLYFPTKSPYYVEDGTIFPRRLRPGDIVVDRRLIHRDPAEARRVAAEIEARLATLEAKEQEIYAAYREGKLKKIEHKAASDKLRELLRKKRFQRQMLDIERRRAGAS